MLSGTGSKRSANQRHGVPTGSHAGRHCGSCRRIGASPDLLRGSAFRATLRTALNAAVDQELITFNAVAAVELDPATRQRPLLWTVERVERWRETGAKTGKVMVWEPADTGRFLDHVHHDRLYALWSLITFRGLRRGEAWCPA